MDIKNFFSRILSGNKGTNIPQAVKEGFINQFDNPLNTEWSKTENHYEAVFYKDETEHIAAYKSNGEFLNLKINLSLGSVPAQVLNTAKAHGELMNAIAIYQQNTVQYDLIVRDQELTRYFLLVTSSGKVLEKQKL
ncbi:MAG: hypothetical protein PHI28_13890 [Mangrovibacterium sp.]|nr:hypothetical protein [Mangrovibacterium sp.]